MHLPFILHICFCLMNLSASSAHPQHKVIKGIIGTFERFWLFSPVNLCSSVLFLDFWREERASPAPLTVRFLLAYAHISWIWPRLPGDRFSTSAVLIRAAGDRSRFHSGRLGNTSARKSRSAAWLAARPAAETFPQRSEAQKLRFSCKCSLFPLISLFVFHLLSHVAARLTIKIMTKIIIFCLKR